MKSNVWERRTIRKPEMKSGPKKRIGCLSRGSGDAGRISCDREAPILC